MRAPDGTTWYLIDDAARDVRVLPSTIRVWISRRRVRSHTVLGRTYVCFDDVTDAEHQWRTRHEKAG